MTYEYKPDDKFGYKDTLPEGHDEKIIKGSEFDDEFKKISNAFKVLDPDFDGDIEIGGIDGLQDALDGKADKSALEKEIQDRINGDQALQDQIDALDPDGDRKVDWTEIEGKPDEFPPEPHTHDQYLTDETDPVFSASPAASITEEMMADWSDHTDPYDDTQIKADLASETQARIKGDEALAQDITDLEAAVGGVAGQLAFGGSYDANAGVIVKSNLSEFVEGQPLPDYSTVEGKFVIVAVAGDTPEELGEADWLVAGESGWVAIKYGTAGSVAWENVVGAPDFLTDAQGSIDGDSKQYVRKNGEWTEATGDSPWERNGDDIYYNDGNVGIGTGNASHFLTIDNPDGSTASRTGAKFAHSKWTNTYGEIVHDTTGSSSNLDINASGSSNFITLSTQENTRMTIDATGNVGIGTSDPEAPLSVTKGTTVGTANNASAVFQASESSGVDAKLVLGVRDGGRPYIHAVDGDTKTADSLDFGIKGNGTAMRIDANGNVGIGTDSPTPGKLVVEEGRVFFTANSEQYGLALRYNADNAAMFLGSSGTNEFRISYPAGGNAFRVGASGAGITVGNDASEDVIISADGNVGIGTTPSNAGTLHLENSSRPNIIMNYPASDNGGEHRIGWDSAGLSIQADMHGLKDTAYVAISVHGTEHVKVNKDGKVGIGMAPLRQASEAKEQLEDWKSAIEERMKAEPKADRSAVTQEITGFDKLPTLEQVKERLTRAAGDKLQVAENISASGTVRCDALLNGGGGLRVGNRSGISHLIATDLSGANTDGEVDLGFQDGTDNRRWRDAYFSGTVSASTAFDSPHWWRTSSNSGLAINGNTIVPVDASGNAKPESVTLGQDANRFESAYFSGTVNAGPFVSNAASTNSGGFVSVLGGESDTALVPVDGNGVEADGTISLGRIRAGADFNKHTRWKDALFSGTVYAKKLQAAPLDGGTYEPTMVIERVHDDAFGTKPVIYSPVYQGCGLKFQSGNAPAIYPTNNMGQVQANALSFGSNAYRFSQGHFNSVYSGGRPVSTTRELIETFRTLKAAVSDETTVEGIKEALTNSLGGLIEKFEAMQSTATQEIDL